MNEIILCKCGHPLHSHETININNPPEGECILCGCTHFEPIRTTESDCQGLPVSFRVECDFNQEPYLTGAIVIFAMNGKITMQSRNLDPAQAARILAIIAEK